MFGVNVHLGRKYAWLDYDLFNQPYDLTKEGQEELENLWRNKLKSMGRGGAFSLGCTSGFFGLGSKKPLIEDAIKLGKETIKVFNNLANREFKFPNEFRAEERLLCLNLVRNYKIIEQIREDGCPPIT